MKREPIISVGLDPKSPEDREKLRRGLERLAATDGAFRAEEDAGTGHTTLWGWTELHLDTILDRLFSDFHVEMWVGAPEVPYRETIIQEIEHTYTHKAIMDGGSGQFAEVTMLFAPRNNGAGNTFESICELPDEFVAGAEKGVQSVLAEGPIERRPVVDVATSLVGGRCLDANSSELAFEIAARMCMREALKQAGALMEPSMMVEAFVAGEHSDSVIGDLLSRRGALVGIKQRDGLTMIQAFVPLANMFGYDPNLLSMTQGAGKYDMWFDHYAPVWQSKGPDDPPKAAAVKA